MYGNVSLQKSEVWFFYTGDTSLLSKYWEVNNKYFVSEILRKSEFFDTWIYIPISTVIFYPRIAV